MACCRCNITGFCRRCVCAKSSKVCSSCLPGRLGKCANTSATAARPTASVATTTAPLVTTAATKGSAATLPASADGSHLGSYLGREELTNVSGSVALPGAAEFLDALEDPSLGDSDQYQYGNAQLSAQEVDCRQSYTWPPALPIPTPPSAPSFSWGMHDADSFIHSLTAAYSEVTHWRKNHFTVPLGNIGKKFVGELSRLFRAFAEQSALESVALVATTVLPILILQKPTFNSKPKDNATCLERRLKLWLEGNINA